MSGVRSTTAAWCFGLVMVERWMLRAHPPPLTLVVQSAVQVDDPKCVPARRPRPGRGGRGASSSFLLLCCLVVVGHEERRGRRVSRLVRTTPRRFASHVHGRVRAHHDGAPQPPNRLALLHFSLTPTLVRSCSCRCSKQLADSVVGERSTDTRLGWGNRSARPRPGWRVGRGINSCKRPRLQTGSKEQPPA